MDSPDFCPSGIGGGGTEFAASSGAARQSGLPIAFPLSSKKTAASPVGSIGRTWQSGAIRGQDVADVGAELPDTLTQLTQ